MCVPQASLSTSLYNVRDLYQMRETYRRTVAVAVARNATAGAARALTGGVTPWLALGCGDRLLPTTSCHGDEQRYNEPCTSFDFGRPYDPVLSWQLGSELNNLSQYNDYDINLNPPLSGRFCPLSIPTLPLCAGVRHVLPRVRACRTLMGARLDPPPLTFST